MEDAFIQNLYGSGAANALSVFLFLVAWFLKNKCKHSRCGAKSACCFIEINDDSTEGPKSPREGLETHEKVEICVHKV